MTDADDADDSIDVETGHIPVDASEAMGGGDYNSREDFEDSATAQLEAVIDDIQNGDEDNGVIIVGMSVEIVGVQADSVDEASQADVSFLNGRALDPEVPISLAPSVFMHANDALIDNSYDVGIRDQLSSQQNPLSGAVAVDASDMLGGLFGGSGDDGPGPFPF